MKTLTYIFIFFFASAVLLSCEKDFLETTPTDAVSASAVTLTTDNALSALNGIHRSLYIRYQSSQGKVGLGALYIMNDALGEDVVMTASGNGWFNNIYKWVDHRNATDADLLFPWRTYYRIIANCNVLINGIDDAEGPDEEKAFIKGESLFLRAFSHYQLVQLYGARYQPGGGNGQPGVVIMTENSSDERARNTVEEVYAQVNADLDDAIANLDGYARVNKSHINADVAKGLKARVALTQGNYVLAASMANAVKSQTAYTLMDSATYANGLRAEDNVEFIWASHIQEDHTDLFGNFGAFLSRNFSSSNIRGNPKAINSKLYDLITDTDVRKTLFDPTGEHANLPPDVTLVSNASKFPYTAQKFISVSNSDSRTDVIHMREAEMYLIEAEALARQGQDGAAAQVLFELISTRDAAYQLSTNTGQNLIDEILTQRRVELWGEGFRWLDLKRLNLPLDRTGANVKASLAGNVLEVPAGDVRWTWLIPQDELDANSLMEQNPL